MPAGEYRAEAHGGYFDAARLRAPGGVPAGVACAHRGAPSWIFVYVDAAHRSNSQVELAMVSGAQVALPTLHIDPKTGSAGATVKIDAHDVAAIRLVDTSPATCSRRTCPMPAHDASAVRSVLRVIAAHA